MRSLVAALLGLGALLLTALALPAMWTERNVVDEDGYVAFTAPLASDHELQSALAQVVAQSVVDNTRVPPAARPVVQKAAARIAGLPGYSDAWRESNRRSHRAVFGDPRDRSPKQDGSDRLVVDVGPFAQLVVDRVNDTAGTHLEAPGQVVVNVGGSNQQRLVERLRSLDPLAYVLAGAAVLLAICSVLLARGRGAALAWLGVGAVAVAGVLKLLTAALLPVLASQDSAASGAGARLATLLGRAAADSFDRWLLVAALAGVVLAVAGGVGRVVSGRSCPR